MSSARRMPHGACRAFSLAEVLIASAILAVFALPLFQTLSVTRRGTALMQEDVGAVLYGLELLDQVKLVPLRYLEGAGSIALPDGTQPLRDRFRSDPAFQAVRASTNERSRAELLLTLELSPLPAGYERELVLEATEGGFARVHAVIRYPSPAVSGRGAKIERRISGLLVAGR